MSACWDSEVRGGAWPRPGRVAGRPIGLLALLLILLPAPALAAADSGRIVRHVRVGPTGIRIEQYGSSAGADRVEWSKRARSVGVLKVERGRLRVEDREDTLAEGDDGRDAAVNVDVDAGAAGLVRLFSDARVPAGRSIPGDVVAVFGSADIEGEVRGDVVAVFGSVRLHPGSRVGGDAIAIGGELDQPAAASVSGRSVALGLLAPGWSAPTVTALVTVVLLGWLATLFLGWLFDLLLCGRMQRIGSVASRHSAGSFFLGLLSAPLFVIALALLFVTVVGIPFALLLPFVYLLAIWTGQIAGSYVLGCRILRRQPGESGVMAPVFVSTLLVAVLLTLGAAFAVPEGMSRAFSLFFTLLGLLLIFGLSTIGTGALMLSRIGSRPAQPAPGPGPGAPIA